MVVKDKTLTKVAKRNMVDIVPLYYEMKKAQPVILNSEVLYEGMIHAYTGGNIGPISNNISKIWNNEEITEQEIKAVKWLCMENNFVIDYAKTLYKPVRPAEVDSIIKSYTQSKLPNFFMYAKDKTINQVENTNTSAMNTIGDSFKVNRICYNKNIGKLDYRVLMNLDYGFDIKEDNYILERFDYYNRHQNFLFNIISEEYQNTQDMYFNKEIKRRLLKETGSDINYLVNTLVACYYTLRPQSQKKLLWECFGDIILENIKKNVQGKGDICPICGKRFEAERKNQKYCSKECYDIAERQRAKTSYSRKY